MNLESNSVSAVDRLKAASLNSFPKKIPIRLNDGTLVFGIIKSTIRQPNAPSHASFSLDDIYYDLPSAGALDLSLWIEDTKGNGVPLAVASMEVNQHDQPEVVQLQRVVARKTTSDGISVGEGAFALTAVRHLVEHPYKTLIQGTQKLEWEKLLLQVCEECAKSAEFNTLSLRSGFASPFFEYGHPLSLALNQYDRFVCRDDHWTPYDEQGNPIANRNSLNSQISKIRNGLLTAATLEGHPMPRTWLKRLV